MKRKYNRTLQALMLPVLLFLFATGCKKIDDWLDVKSNKSDVMPSSITDFQAILDNTINMNTNYPSFGMVGSDNFYVPDANFGSLTQDERNAYRFMLTGYATLSHGAYSSPYIAIGMLNIVLDGLKKIPSSSANYDNVIGQALFHRSNMFYHLSQLYCKPYSAATAATDPGLQLKTTSDPNIVAPRSSVQESFKQMISDLTTAIGLLPESPLYTTRPGITAAYTLLAKVYLSMEDYTNAGKYAQLALSKHKTLLDYNSPLIQPSTTYRFPAYSNLSGNPEIIFYAQGQTAASLWPSLNVSYVDSSLYKSYHTNDLRKKLYYIEDAQQRAKFCGTYTGSSSQFAGLATNELYLISAECKARGKDVAGAMADLNALLEKRWSASAAFAPYVASDPDEALRTVLTERRKELPFTGQLRWEDLRRLNKDSRFATSVVHINNGISYVLPPGDRRYLLLIPELEITISGIAQNER